MHAWSSPLYSGMELFKVEVGEFQSMHKRIFSFLSEDPPTFTKDGKDQQDVSIFVNLDFA